jgi:hypothetical protein
MAAPLSVCTREEQSAVVRFYARKVKVFDKQFDFK